MTRRAVFYPLTSPGRVAGITANPVYIRGSLANAPRHSDMGFSAHTASFSVRTRGKGTYEITSEVARIVTASGVATGSVTVFIRHTSASLVIYENADPSARTDLHGFFERLVPEGQPWFSHTDEGPDDMPSHLRMVLTRTSETIPIAASRMGLGTWQGIFLFEHRRAPHTRELIVSVMGER